MRNLAALFFLIVFPLFYALAEIKYTEEVVINSLEEALGIGLSNSNLMKYQNLNMLLNMRLARHSIKGFIPVLSLSLSENDSVKIGAGDSHNKSVQFSVKQMVFDGGKTKLQYDLARINSIYSYYELRSAVKQFEIEITNQYENIMLAKKKLKIQEDLLSSAQSSLRVIKKQYELGLALESDYLEYAISTDEIKIEKARMENEERKLYRQFNLLLSLPENTRLLIKENRWKTEDFKLLSGFKDDIFYVIKRANKDLEKEKINLLAKKKQIQLSKRLFLPDVSLEASMNFSGRNYPLTQPSFSVKCNIAFNNDILPLSLSSGYGFSGGKFNSVQNSAGTSIPKNISYFHETRAGDISVSIEELNFENKEKEFKETVIDTIETHDYLINGQAQKSELIKLSKRKIEVDRQKLETGDFKNIDFLNELIDLAKAEIDYIEGEYKIMNCERSLELLANMNHGGLENVTGKNK